MREYNPHIEGSLVYDKEYDNGNSGGSITIDWNNCNKQVVTLTEAVCAFTFTNPMGACNLVLRVVQDGAGSRTIDWTAVPVKWAYRTAPVLSTGISYEDIICFYFNGTYYYGQSATDFA